MNDAQVKEVFEVLANKTMKNREDCRKVWADESYRKQRIAEVLAKYPALK